MLVRTRSEYACVQLCLNNLRRTVWDGDQVLYEISAPGGSTATAAQMEADTGIAAPLFINANGGVNAFFPYGRVLYEHGGGIDAPLGVVRMEYSDTLRGPQVIIPHANWRGSYARGTTIGSCFVYGTNGKFLLPPPDSTPTGGDGTRIVGGQYDGSAEHCINVDWPAAYTWSARQYRRGYDGPVSWMGSLIYESRDASGLYYRRNRYYDSEKGRFTQEDPIGLAGGVNVYGFAAGDPISYSDPFGLCIPAGSAICVFLTAYREHGIRGVVNEAVGVTPLGDLNDLATAASGRNLITGERAGRGGRAVAALGAMVPLASSTVLRTVGREAAMGGEILHRFGTEVESAEDLARQAAKAEANNFPHGVSTFNRPSTRSASSTARRSDVEAHFPVENTGSRGHRTVVLPKPVTQEAADTFNRLFGRIP